jgi:hypothetical protein
MDLIETGVKNPICHWYYAHKFHFIVNSNLFKSGDSISLVDIGAGSALFSKELLKRKIISKSIAVDTGYQSEYDDPSVGISYRRSINYGGHTHFLLTDVLEHIDDDLAFLKDVVSKADSKSGFIITVPALKSLWSGHDLYLKHFRRYTKSNLHSLAENSGLEVISLRYTYSTLFPIAFIQRKLVRSKDASSQMKDNNVFVSWLLKLLLIPDKWITFLPFGVSLYMEAIKNV